MRKEVDLMAQLRHECICSVIGICIVNESNLWLVLEYVSGGDLHHFLESDVPLDTRQQINLCLQAARAINFLHSQALPVLHRDIKSNNFLIPDPMRLKLTDFGLASIRTEPVFTQGTVNWTAPEIVASVAEWTEKTDIYSLGMVFYEIVARKIPFSDLSEEDIKTAVINGDRPPLSSDVDPVCYSKNCGSLVNLYKGLAAIIKLCWDPIPNSRPTAKDLVTQLRSLLQSSL